MKFIRSVDIGVLKAIPSADTADNDDTSESSGFVSIGYHMRGKVILVLLLERRYHGAPFRKENEATAWLVSFLNVVARVANCDDNFLILGANCKEDHPAKIKYAKQLRTDIECIESILNSGS